jgi:hypothetical protein
MRNMNSFFKRWTKRSAVGAFLTWEGKMSLLERKARAEGMLENFGRLRGEGVLLELT